MMMAAGLLTATSCSDFDDYNEVQINPDTAANLTLWENIEQNPQLSDFEELIVKAGFDDELASSHYYTVWAPLNGTFDKSDFSELTQEELLEQFVYNHVADYNHTVSGEADNRVYTLNRKTYFFKGVTGSYTFANVPVAQANVPSKNGVLHTMNGAAMFYFNLYDFIMARQDTDSLSKYFAKYETRELDEASSVKGPMVNGLQTYVDSVMIIENSLLGRNWLDADLLHEDSSYTFLMPTNKAWDDSYNKIKPYYNFIQNTICQDLYTASGSTKIPTMTTGNINQTLLADSMTKRYLVNYLVYSNNDTYNALLTNGQPIAATDSIRTTTRRKFSNPSDILAQTVGEPVKMSNGWGRQVDSLAFYPWETFAPEIDFNPRSYAALVTAAGSQENITVKFAENVNKYGDFTETSGELTFYNVEPSGARNKPEMFVFLPNVRSTTYKFYVVFVPGSVTGADNRPNQVNFVLNYCDAKGALAKHNFSSELKNDNPKKQTPFVNDTSKVDTMYIGDFTFPVSYAGLPVNGGKSVMPDLKISSPMSVFNQTLLNTYTRALRIAAIIMKPVELVEFEEKQN